MENPAATGLPEVDALPDGFVESTPEPLGPLTPAPEQENNRVSDTSKHGDLHESIQESEPVEVEAGVRNVEKTQKPRNFPVPLSETENFDASLELLDENDGACKEQLMPHLADSRSESSVKSPGQSEVKEQVLGKSQSSERRNSDTQAADVRELPLSGSNQASKVKKPEASETKRKNVKRSSKSEKDILEFTLKYQQVLAERDAAIAVRDKLESLCRELQRQNKMLMGECKHVSTEGQNLRLELSAKFQDAIKEVSNKLEHQKDESLSQLKENEMLKIKLKQLADQYVLSEQHHEQELKQKTLELQIAELKIKQHEEKMTQEQSQMKMYAEQVSQLLATEKNLRLQLTADGEKFQQFQDALVKSNEVFETFKQEIEKMAKSIKDLKKENMFLKSKCEKSDFTLIELVEERERTKKQMEKLKNQKEKLESLCRTLQAERRQNSSVSNSSDSLQS
ncbi:beta-taxilin isoform X2 [Punica granatum]|uniref:Beta-taxilin isoform X2 n=1 Tax=Punica granatum TaxID=22663 RepID=A0A6P8CFR6_PUNGR|nr:beta-taxilin isoform X2 [Punica granatum]